MEHFRNDIHQFFKQFQTNLDSIIKIKFYFSTHQAAMTDMTDPQLTRQQSEQGANAADENAGISATMDGTLELFDESKFSVPPELLESDVFLWRGSWDSKGVYVYQAFNDVIADYAVQHQKFEGK